jgi:Tfp pilus assembly protein PilF
MRRGRYEAARTSLERAIALEPGYAKAYVALGTLDMEQGRPAEAAAAFRRAVALNPRDAQTYAQFALLAQRAGDVKTAEGAYREALRYDPDNPEIHNHLGALYLDRRNWSHALDQFTAAIRGDPGHMEAAFNRAVALYRLGRVDEAAAAIQALLPRLPLDPEFDPYRRAAQAILRAGGTGADPPARRNPGELAQ